MEDCLKLVQRRLGKDGILRTLAERFSRSVFLMLSSLILFRRGETDSKWFISQAIQSRGGKFTLSDDSHGPALVGQHYDRLFDYLESQNLESLYYLTSLARVGDDVKLENEIRRSRGVIIRKIEGKPWLKEWRK